MIWNYAEANSDDLKEAGVTKGKLYPVFKITYPESNPEGLIIVITEKSTLIRTSARYFNFLGRKEF